MIRAREDEVLVQPRLLGFLVVCCISKIRIVDDAEHDLVPDHETVAAGGLDCEELQGTSVEALHQDDSAERDAVEIPQKISQAEEHLRKVRLTNESFERMVTATRELAAKAGRLATDRVELEIASNELAALKTQGAELAAQAEAKKSAIAVLKQALGNQESIINGLRGLVSQADQLKRSEAALAELKPHEQAAVNELAKLEARLAVTPEPAPPLYRSGCDCSNGGTALGQGGPRRYSIRAHDGSGYHQPIGGTPRSTAQRARRARKGTRREGSANRTRASAQH
jgi:hypothetical protein